MKTDTLRVAIAALAMLVLVGGMAAIAQGAERGREGPGETSLAARTEPDRNTGDFSAASLRAFAMVALEIDTLVAGWRSTEGEQRHAKQGRRLERDVHAAITARPRIDADLYRRIARAVWTSPRVRKRVLHLMRALRGDDAAADLPVR